MKFKFEDVFITGSNGWLGRQIVECLINNDREVLEMEKSTTLKINCLINENDIIQHSDFCFAEKSPSGRFAPLFRQSKIKVLKDPIFIIKQ